MRKTFFILLLVLIGCFAVFNLEFVSNDANAKFLPQYNVKYKVKVIDVVDGDTIDVLLPDGSIGRIRMLGIDTPETTASKNRPYEYDSITNLTCLEYWGLEAKNFTKSELEGKYAYIEFDPVAGARGYYGRLLAYVYINDTDFTAELVKRGYARVYEEGECQKESEYLMYQAWAMNNSTGLWSCSIAETTKQGKIVISYVNYDAPGNDNKNPNGEFVVLKNEGNAAVNLKGWYLKDEQGHKYVFPDFVLHPGDTVKIHSGSGVDTKTDLYWGYGRAIWNNNGDTAYLYDSSGRLVDEHGW